MNTSRITPKDFFLWVGAMAALYASVFAFVSLIFGYLDHVFPDALSYYSGDPYSSGISMQMATIIVLLPVFFALMWIIRRSIAADPTRREVWVRRWALFLTIFIAGATVAGDLVTLVVYFLNGDVTLRFLLKVLTILLVAGGGFMHFLADLRGFWDAQPRQRMIMAWAVGIVALVSIIAGFFIVGTPWQARLYRYDDQKVSDLQSIQYQIVNYWQSKEKIPTALADLQDPISGFIVPHDPQTGLPYEYQVTGPMAFELCASFNAETQQGSQYATRTSAPIMPEGGRDITRDSWYHAAGRVCFTRTIDPQLYPPYPKTNQPVAKPL